MPALSPVMLTLRTVGNITSAWRVLHVNMVVPLVQFSRLVTLMAQETVKIQKMFLDGKYSLS